LKKYRPTTAAATAPINANVMDIDALRVMLSPPEWRVLRRFPMTLSFCAAKGPV